MSAANARCWCRAACMYQRAGDPMKNHTNSAERAGLRWNAIVPILLLFVLTGTVCGCGSLLVSAKGARIVEGRRIPIETGAEQSGHHQAADLLVKYQYRVTGNTLEMWGSVRFSSSIQMNFTTLRSFNLQLLVADSQGVILTTRNIAGTTFRLTEDELTFRDSFPLPDGAQLMAFAYRGIAAEGGGAQGRRRAGDGGGGQTTFFDFPVVR